MKLCGVLALLASPVFGEPPAPATAPGAPVSGAELKLSPEVKWRVQAVPGIYFVAPGGNMIAPGIAGGGKVKLDDINLDSTRTAPIGRVDVRGDPWRFTIDGFGFSMDQSQSIGSPLAFGNSNLVPGDSLFLSLDFASVEATVGYRVWEWVGPLTEDGRVRFLPSLTPFVGARLYDIELSGYAIQPLVLPPPGGPPPITDVDKVYAEGIVGVRFEVEFWERWTIDLRAGAGYGGDVSSRDIWVGFQWRPVGNVGVQVGYRMLAFDIDDGDGAGRFRWDGSVAGLNAGLVLRF